MATHRIPMLGWQTVPDSSGNVFFEKADVKASNDVWDRLVCVFNDTDTRDGLHGAFNVPKNYSSSPKLIIVWTTTATGTNNVEWDFDYRAVGGVESLDQAGTQETVNANSGDPASTDLRVELSISLTDSNFAPDDIVLFTLFRDGTDGGDTIAAAVQLVDLLFEYSD